MLDCPKIMNEKIWFIDIEGKQEGPYSVFDLSSDPRIKPETLVWKEGFEKWVPIEDVPELRIVFKDVEEPEPEKEELEVASVDEEATLDMKEPPPFMRYVLLVAIGILLFFLFQFFWGQ